MRTRKGAARHRSRKRLARATKGYWGSRSKLTRVGLEALHRAWRNGWIHRRQKKRDMRRLWISRITAAVRARGLNYSRFVYGMKKAGLTLNRKMLSEIAISDPGDFDRIVELAKEHV